MSTPSTESTMAPFAELSPPYATIVADPPWPYDGHISGGAKTLNGVTYRQRREPYSGLAVDAVANLPVAMLAAPDANLFLWTTNRYVHDAFHVAESWGFRPVQTLVWCKPPKGLGPGGLFANATEFVLYCRVGRPARSARVERTWWLWPRGAHSVKPPAFLDIVERVSPGPYVELFARAPRLGWDSWGLGYETERVS